METKHLLDIQHELRRNCIEKEITQLKKKFHRMWVTKVFDLMFVLYDGT
jgi:hypothetical protein